MREMKRPVAKDKLVRFDSPSQVERVLKAAELKRWSFNRFMVEAAEYAANQILMANKNGSKPLIVESNPLALNQ